MIQNIFDFPVMLTEYVYQSVTSVVNAKNTRWIAEAKLHSSVPHLQNPLPIRILHVGKYIHICESQNILWTDTLRIRFSALESGFAKRNIEGLIGCG